MGLTERRFLAAATIASLLALSAPAGAAALDAAAGTGGHPPASLPGSPAAFAERVAGPPGRPAGGYSTGNLQNTIELIVLVATCAIGVAFYSSTSARSEGARVPARSGRR